LLKIELIKNTEGETMKEQPRILIVDDTPANIKILNDLLRDTYRVSVATNGADALELISNEPPDLILLDIMMPEMDGYEVCQRLKDNESTRDIPVIFVTAMGEVEDETRGLELGVVDYITKPISPPIVLARIKNHLDLKEIRDNLEDLVAERTKELEDSQEQVIQQEKMAAIGQLAAGVAHEINNPTGYIGSNLNTLHKYIQKIDDFFSAQTEAILSLGEEKTAELKTLRKKMKIDFIVDDIKDLVSESLEGIDRTKDIVMGLKNISRKDQDVQSMADINECLESTLKVIWNELKYKTTVEKEYGDLPKTKCFPQQLSQVFMNLLVNAGHAIEEKGTISIKTRMEDDSIFVSISDTGCGIAPENLEKIFEAFFTTKEIGQGTGLGMSIASEIIQKHNGEIDVESKVGQGTKFTIKIPVVEE